MDLGKLRELSTRRQCRECGARFESIPGTLERGEVPALEQFSDHLTMHQPTVSQWAAAYQRIQAGRKKSG